MIARLWRNLAIYFVGVAVVAVTSGCRARQANRLAAVNIAGETFHLEVAADSASQEKGLAGRDDIARNGGMIFVFAAADWQSFVMRDCSISLDIAYLGDDGTIIKMWTMQPEPPRGVGESAVNPSEDAAYNARLKSYPSEGPASFAIELRAGTLSRLSVKEGDRVVIDMAGLSPRNH